MTKQDLIRQVADRTGIDPFLTRSVIESFFEVTKASLREGEPIYIRTFGSFQVKLRAAKIGRNISQNIAVKIEAHVVPSFKPSLEFIDQVRARERPVATKKAKP